MWYSKFKKIFRKRHYGEIDPDEIFLDSKNLPNFDNQQFEGRMEKPISRLAIFFTAGVFLLIFFVYIGKIWTIEVSEGASFKEKSENNRLRHSLIFAERGVIYDRENNLLAWNTPNPKGDEVSLRVYNDASGLSNLVGFIKYPTKDSAGFYYREDFVGVDGAEKFFDYVLKGENGIKITETDALGKISSESVIKPPKDGDSVFLSVDSKLQQALYGFIESLAKEVGFTGGAGILMDINTGELYSLVTYPEYNSTILTDGKNKEAIDYFVNSGNKHFLNRAIFGLYTPGSIVKPFLALGALTENIISPEKQILSTGSISISNPYDKTKKTIFTDWKAHGLVDMRTALAISSNVYFYEIGGGFEDQRGLGIVNIEKYMRMFGFGESVFEGMFDTPTGVIPNPEWKKENFKNEEWRIGDTYNTSIGQYGFQVTPIQIVRGVSAIANGGKRVEPTFIKSNKNFDENVLPIPVAESSFDVVREGMRRGVLMGTASGLNIPQVKIAAKTGTAELGTKKEFVNSWVTGFFPFDKPRFAFAVIMEKGPRSNTIGALYVMRRFVEWMSVNTPEYIEAQNSNLKT